MPPAVVTVAEYGTAAAAHLARIELEEAGIDAYVEESTPTHWMWTQAPPGGVPLQVRAEDLERARAVLRAEAG